MVTLTTEEWDALGDPELGGSAAKQKAHLANEEMTVFGRDIANQPVYKKVKGVPQELGIGSHGHETSNHFAGILKYEGTEAHQAALEEIWKRDPERAKKLMLPKPRAKAA